MEVKSHESGLSADNELAKIRFSLDDLDVKLGVEAEILWARRLDEHLFRIDNIPFYLYGISNCDEVWALGREGILQFEHVVRRGGHSTYRVLVVDSEGFESTRWKERWPQLASLGCICEVAKRRWIAIDIPASSNADSVYSLLLQGKLDGIWSIDEGHCGHLL